MRRVIVALAVLAACAAPGVARADRAYDVLAPGQFGGLPQSAHSTDQIALYDGLTPLRGDVGAADLDRYFKPETLAPVGPTTLEATPRPGVTIRRDQWGVPHIYGDTRADLWWGAGWVAAADRGLFLQLGRGPARAAVADIPGLNAFSLVTGARSFTPSDQTERLVTSQQRRLVRAHGANGRKILRALDAYSAGINAYYAAQPGADPAPWTRNDTIAAFSFVGSIFGNGGGEEARNAQFLSALRERLGGRRGRHAFSDLMEVRDPEARTTIGRRFRFGRASARASAGSPRIDAGSLELAPDPSQPAAASNFLLASDGRSAGAATLAAMGPQLGFYYPAIVLEAGLHGPGIEAQGALGPGIGPYMLIGRTRDYAWSLTTAENDNRDTFLERLCGTDRYVHDGDCVRMKRFRAGTLGASGSQPEREIEYLTTVHGPVIGYARVDGERHAVVRSRSTYGRDAASLAALRGMTLGGASSPRRFFRIVNRFEFTFNWAYLSHRAVAFFSAGRIPRGAPGLNELLPRLGTGPYDWDGFLPRRRHPQAVKRRGLLLNWNNKPAPGWMSGDNVHKFGSVHRVDLFDGFPSSVRLEDLVSVMNRAATQDLRTEEVWPAIRAVLGDSDAPDARTAQAVAIVDRGRGRGSARLDADLDGRVDDPGAAVVDAAFEPLADAVMRPVLGPLVDDLATLMGRDSAPYKGNGSSFDTGWYGYVEKDLRTLLGRPVKGRFRLRYCGAGSLSACRASLWAALAGATASLAAAQGDDPEAWRADAMTERIDFQPGLIGETMRWANRPTFQQVLEFDAG